MKIPFHRIIFLSFAVISLFVVRANLHAASMDDNEECFQNDWVLCDDKIVNAPDPDDPNPPEDPQDPEDPQEDPEDQNDQDNGETPEPTGEDDSAEPAPYDPMNNDNSIIGIGGTATGCSLGNTIAGSGFTLSGIALIFGSQMLLRHKNKE